MELWLNLASHTAKATLLSILDSRKRGERERERIFLEFNKIKRQILAEYMFILHEMQHGKEHIQTFCGLVHYNLI